HHSFAVGPEALLVHNTSGSRGSDPSDNSGHDNTGNPPRLTTVPEDLYAFGNTTQPRSPRTPRDIAVDENGMVHPDPPEEWPSGASSFADPEQAPLGGPYHVLPAGTELPPGITVTPDGQDVGGSRGPTHHTFAPSESMSFGDFVDLFGPRVAA